MIIHVALLAAFGIVGLVVGGALGVAAVVVPWAVVLIVSSWFPSGRAQTRPGPEERPTPSAYADVEDVNDRLDDLVRQRGWDLDKRLEIALMACEKREATFDELDRAYDRGLRSAFGEIRQDTSQEPKHDESV